ncbi:hypothetical protein V8G54_016579 [Vigna mungo]|uniref:Uncharacterized protein n=1 Tax=Vigna mungo TaxID=3915 RepID=A0AAQ3S1H8_VIGMU
MIGAGKYRRRRGIGEKENRTERSGNRTVEAENKRTLVTFHSRIRNNWSDLPDRRKERTASRVLIDGSSRYHGGKNDYVQSGFQELMKMIEGLNRQREGHAEQGQASVHSSLKDDMSEKGDGANDGERNEPNGNDVGGPNGVEGGGPNGKSSNGPDVARGNGGRKVTSCLHLYGRQCGVLVQVLEGVDGKPNVDRAEGGRNQGPVFERLATSKQSGIVEEYNQPLNEKELLESNGSNARGLPEPNSSRLRDPNVRERAEPKERGLVEPNGRVLRELIGSGLTNSNVRGLPELNDSGLTNSNVRGLPEPNANGRRLLDPNMREWAEPKERGPTKPNKRGRPELTVRKLSEPNGLVLEGRIKVLVGRVDGRINALERTKNSLKWWTIEKNRGLVIFDTLAEGRERCEVLKDIEDHFLKTCDSGKRVNKILNEEWKTLEEVLPPPKPPDLNWRATASEYRPYDNMRMKGSQEIKFHSSNLEDKVVLQRGVMLGAGKYMIGARKCRRGRGIGEKENRTERSGNRTVEAGN